MERLIQISEKKRKGIKEDFQRYLFEQIDLPQRMTGL
jgi:hypothetical protein